jgi:hypothetical protein
MRRAFFQHEFPESPIGVLERAYAACDREFDFDALSARATHSSPLVEIIYLHYWGLRPLIGVIK